MEGMKTILVDAWQTFVVEGEGIFREMHKLLDTFPNPKIVVSNANDAECKQFGFDRLPCELFTLQHNPDKTDLKFFKTLLQPHGLKVSDVIYFEHTPKAVESAQSIGIQSYYYDSQKRDLKALKKFLTESLK